MIKPFRLRLSHSWLPIRILIHISRNTAGTVLSVILVAVLLFFALTRTQVGRDGLRMQLVRSFDAQFEGRLEIDRLSGNLVNDLFAGGVRLYDGEGELVLSVDSVVAQPSWRDLFRRSISLGSLTLYRPELKLDRSEESAWNVVEALRQAAISGDAAPAGNPWSFTTLRLQVFDGTIEAHNHGSVPGLVRDGHLFDYTNARAEGVDLRATVDWRSASRIVEIQSASAELSTLGLPLTTLQGQVILEEDDLLVPVLDFEIGNSRGSFSGAIEDRHLVRTGDSEIRVQLTETDLDLTELQRVFPSSPLRDRVVATVRAHGPISDLVLEEFSLAQNGSRLRIEGIVQGLPASADFEAAIRDARIAPADLKRLVPTLDLSSFAKLTAVHLSVDSHGIIDLTESSTRSFANASWTLSSNAGDARGHVQLRDGRERRFGYEAAVEAIALDLGKFLNESSLSSRLSGTVAVEGETDDFSQVEGSLSAYFSPSTFAGREVDTLRAELAVAGRSFSGSMFGRQGRGVVGGRLSGTLGQVPSYDLSVTAAGLDAGRLLLNDSLTTDLNGSIQLSGGGRTWDTFRGRVILDLDTSRVALGTRERLVLPTRTQVALADVPGGGSRLAVTGDVLEASLTGSTNPKVLVRVGALWSELLAQSIYRDLFKPYPGRQLADADAEDGFDREFRRGLSKELLRVIALHRPTGSVVFEGSVRVRDAGALVALVPELPSLATDLEATFTLRSDASTLGGSFRIDADSLRIDDLSLAGLGARGNLSAHLDADANDDISIRLEASASDFAIGERRFSMPRAQLFIDEGNGSINIASGDSTGEAIELEAEIASLADRTILTLDRLRYAAGGYEWINGRRDQLDLYEGAVLFRDLLLVNRDESLGEPQQIHVSGAFSSVPGDTMVVVADNVALYQLTRALSGAVLGGTLSGRLALTGGIRQPELTGRLDVEHLQMDNRLLGDLRVRSHYVPGLPDVQIDARLRPSANEPPTITADGRRTLLVEENQVHLSGRFRLPEFDERGRRVRPSVLDLNVEAKRADTFFFEYIFREITDVSGYIAGNGRITGSLIDPIFDLSLDLYEAGFSVPDYNLRFNAEAKARIDRDGIHIDDGYLTDKTGGSADLWGSILFNDYRYFSFDLAARLREVQIMDVTDSRRGLSFYGRIWASGNATLTGPLHAAVLQAPDVMTSSGSEVYIPITEVASSNDPGFIVFADSAGNVPDIAALTQRDNILARRPVGERPFVDALGMDLNIFAPPGSTIHLVIDPLLGDMMNAVGTGRIQLVRSEGEYYTYGMLDVSAGDYLFTAGDVFMRRFLIDEGTIRWDGDPTDAQLDVRASYRTRASAAGLPGLSAEASSAPLIPLVVQLHITARVSSPAVDLSLALERRDQDVVAQGLEAILNDPERSTQYATSVLLTNTFLLTTDQFADGDVTRSGTRNQFAFNSLSQLVASQINRYLSHALPNVDVNFGLQGERAQDLDVTYGVALRLMDERLIIRGEGVYQNDRQNPTRGEFVVEVRLTPGVSVEMFYRREGDVLSDQTLTNTTGAGVSYETRFSSWDRLWRRLFGWAYSGNGTTQPSDEPELGDAGRPVRDRG